MDDVLCSMSRDALRKNQREFIENLYISPPLLSDLEAKDAITPEKSKEISTEPLENQQNQIMYNYILHMPNSSLHTFYEVLQGDNQLQVAKQMEPDESRCSSFTFY